MTVTTPGPTARLRDARVVFWLFAEVVSLVGDTVFFLVLSWTAIRLAGPGGPGIVLACAAVPRALLMLLGGAVVDRFGARRIAMGTDLIRGCVVAGAAVVATFSITLGLLVGLALVFGVFDALFYPASGSLAPLIVAGPDLVRIQGLRTLGTRVALILGAAAGGLIIEYSGFPTALAIDAVTFGCSLMALALVRITSATEADPAERLITQLRAGLTYARDDVVLRNVLVLVALFEFSLNGVANVGFPTLANRPGGGSSAFGTMVAALGAGAALASVVLALLRRSLRPYLVLSGAAVLGGGVAAVMPHFHSDIGVAALAFGLGVSGGCVGGLAVPIAQLGVEPRQLGRVMSLFSVATVGMAPFSLALASLAIRQSTPSWAFAGAGVLAVGGGLACFSSARVRELRLPDRRPKSGSASGTVGDRAKPVVRRTSAPVR